MKRLDVPSRVLVTFVPGGRFAVKTLETVPGPCLLFMRIIEVVFVFISFVPDRKRL
jgi:hypothetical protein